MIATPAARLTCWRRKAALRQEVWSAMRAAKVARLDFIVTPERVIDCRRGGPRPTAGLRWEDLTEEKIAAIPPLAAQRNATGERRASRPSRRETRTRGW